MRSFSAKLIMYYLQIRIIFSTVSYISLLYFIKILSLTPIVNKNDIINEPPKITAQIRFFVFEPWSVSTALSNTNTDKTTSKGRKSIT